MATIRGGQISDQVFVQPSDNGFSFYDENPAIASGGTGSVLTYTVPALNTLYLKGVQGSGGASAIFKLEIASVVQDVFRTSYFERNCGMRFDSINGLEIAGGTLIEVKVTNNGESTNAFWSKIYGVLL